jgi:hypothetical protein
MKPKNILLLFSMIMLAFSMQAQVKFAGSSDIKAFLKSKTYVVEYDDPFSNFTETMKLCMPKFWTITPYEFITNEEFEKKKTNASYSFIFLSEAQLTEDGFTGTYNFLNVVMGGSSDMNKMPDLGSVPLSYSEVDEDSYLYKLGGLLLFIQDHINYSSENSSLKPSITKKNSTIDIKTKELWLLSEELPTNLKTLDKIKLVYPYTVKIVTKEDIKKAIETKNANVIFLHKVGPEGTVSGGKCWKFLVSAQTGEVIYYESHKITATVPDALLESDFKSFGK